MAEYFVPVYPAEYSEVRKYPFGGTLPDAVWGQGILVRLDTTNGLVMPIFGTGANRPTADVLTATGDSLFGVTVGSNQELTDPVVSSRMDYAGQTPVRRVSVAICVPHRELIVVPIFATGNNAGDPDPSIAVPSNIGRGVKLRYQNFSILVGTTRYWPYAGAFITGSEPDGFIVGITQERRLIVRLVRNRWIELA